jgi:FixJ family two-component response regulator
MMNPSATGSAPACICVVDDDDAVREAMADLLESGGYHCLAFASAEALLSRPNLGGIDLVIFDVKLRAMSRCALQARCAALGADLPLLFVSGHGDADLLLEHIERALQGRPRP